MTVTTSFLLCTGTLNTTPSPVWMLLPLLRMVCPLAFTESMTPLASMASILPGSLVPDNATTCSTMAALVKSHVAVMVSAMPMELNMNIRHKVPNLSKCFFISIIYLVKQVNII